MSTAIPGRITSLRLGVFGGTFDPIHDAHLKLGRAAAEQAQLNEVLFIPAAHPPHRLAGPFASYEDRLRMVELACAGEPRFRPSRLEQDEPISYSILTVEKLRGTEPDAGLFFLIGADAFAELRTWRRWQELVTLVDFIVAGRPGARYTIPEGARVHALDLDLPISSSHIRVALAAGERRLPLPDAVESYIFAHRLYGSHNNSQMSETLHSKDS